MSETPTRWTPGPWDADPIDNEIYDAGGELLAYTHQMSADAGDVHRTANHNAHIIAAAPELYAALNDIMKCVEAGVLVRDTSRDRETGWALHQLPLVLSLKAAVAALAKARGEALTEEGQK